MSARICTPLLALFIGLSLPSCVVFTEHGYEEFAKDLDGRSELSVSTYPAGAARDKMRIPYVFRRAESADQVYFQVFVRDMKKRFGHNPNIDSIRINSFSYRVGKGPRKELISGFTGNYWMQDNRTDAPGNPPPAPFVKGEKVTFHADLSLNGKSHKISGTMSADSSTWFAPLPFYGAGN
jgi:hypothetical protein